jgi:hypothetical protein
MLTMKLARNTAMILRDIQGYTYHLQSDREVMNFLSTDDNLWLTPPHQITRLIAHLSGVKVEKVHIILQIHSHSMTGAEVDPALLYQAVMAIVQKLEHKMPEDAVIKTASADHDCDFRWWLKILAIMFIRCGTKRSSRPHLEKILTTQHDLPPPVEPLHKPRIRPETPTPSEAETDIVAIEDSDTTPSRPHRVNPQNAGGPSVLPESGTSEGPHQYILRDPAADAARQAAAQSGASPSRPQDPQYNPARISRDLQTFGAAYAQYIASGNGIQTNPGIMYTQYILSAAGTQPAPGPGYAAYILTRVMNDYANQNNGSSHQQTRQASGSQSSAHGSGHAGGMRGTEMDLDHQSSVRNDGNYLVNPIRFPGESIGSSSSMHSGTRLTLLFNLLIIVNGY